MKHKKDYIDKLAWLARLELSTEEKKAIAKEIEWLRRLIDRVLEAPVEDVKPLYHPLESEGTLREDKPKTSIRQQDVLFLAANHEKGFVKAPRILED